MDTKPCSRCKLDFPLESFQAIKIRHKRWEQLDSGDLEREIVERAGRGSYCPECIKVKWSEQNARRRAGVPAKVPQSKRERTPEEKRNGYEAVKAWRSRNRDDANACGNQYKRMQRCLIYTGAWGAISRHYGGCVGCPGEYDGCSYVIDHVAPLLPDDESRNCLANLQPLCFRCNLKKSKRTVDWRPDKGAWILQTFPYANAVFKLKEWAAMMTQE